MKKIRPPGPEVRKHFSCSTELKFQLLIKTKIPTNKEVSCFKSLRCCIYHDNKCWHFNIYEHDEFHAQLSWAWKSFITSRPVLKTNMYRIILDFLRCWWSEVDSNWSHFVFLLIGACVFIILFGWIYILLLNMLCCFLTYSASLLVGDALFL